MPDGERDPEPSAPDVLIDSETLVMTVAGAIDASTGPSLRAQLIELVQVASRSGRVACLDLGGVDFIDSVGLNVLVAAHEAASGALELANVSPNCRRVFEITHLDEVFVIRR